MYLFGLVQALDAQYPETVVAPKFSGPGLGTQFGQDSVWQDCVLQGQLAAPSQNSDPSFHSCLPPLERHLGGQSLRYWAAEPC